MEKNRQEWLARPENAHYWRDNPKSKKRVREWRKKNPDYWKRAMRRSGSTLPEEMRAKTTGQNRASGALDERPLPEQRWREDPVIMGIIGVITGCTLPEQIAQAYRDVVAKGREILGTQKATRVAGPKRAQPVV